MTMFNRFMFGGDWNPEQWPEDTWEHDIRLLERAHINEATINVFSWALLQPDEQTYDFSMLDRIIDLLVRHGFAIVLATGTAAIPAWMARDYPQVMRTGVDGTHQVFGGRHNFCPTSPDFRRFARALASRVAERYAGTPDLEAWHVNNEYGNGGGYCYCDLCAQAFRGWLEPKSGAGEALNRARRDGRLSAPVVLGRDHHDVSGTDSPYRETSNIYDGSRFTADMAVQNVIGDSFRGATWVSLHNGGGVGWGEVINGGFGMLLDGTDDSDRRLKNMLFWDVNNGISRRSWARNEGAIFAIKRAMEANPALKVTLPNFAEDGLIEKVIG